MTQKINSADDFHHRFTRTERKNDNKMFAKKVHRGQSIAVAKISNFPSNAI